MACTILRLLWKTPAFGILRTLSLASTRCFCKHQPTVTAQNFSDYESIHKQYKPEVPEYFNFAKDVVDVWAKEEKEGRRSSHPALWWVSDQGQQVKWSFEELALESQKAARVLSNQCGLQKGDRVIVILPRVPEWWLMNLACIRTGTVLIPGTTQLTAKDILHRLQASRARCIVTDELLAPAVDAVASKCPSLESKLIVSRKPREGWLYFSDLLKLAPGEHSCVATKSLDPMAIYFTSGTTGAPKMTEHSHASHGIGLTVNGRYWLDLSPSDTIWNTSDTGWGKSAWSSVFAPWIQGACVFAHGMPRFEPELVLEVLSKFPITTFCSPPTAYRMLVHQNLTSYKFHSLKHCVSAGEPMNPEVMEKWEAQTELAIYEGYGQTETVLVCGTFKGMKIKPGSMGKPSPAYDVQIIDEDGTILPPGKEGNIAIRIKPTRPFCLFTQYTDDPERTASTICGDFYITGDRGIKDEDDYFWFIGRADDVINSAGYRIGPFEVESALIEHPAVVESAVVSSPDPRRGEVVKAFVVLAPDYASHDPEALIKELQDHVKKVTAPYKYPRKMILDSVYKISKRKISFQIPEVNTTKNLWRTARERPQDMYSTIIPVSFFYHVKGMTEGPNLFGTASMEFVPHLPKTISGKIRRNELRKKEWGKA